jgi:CHASE2 domain-containing sensor protein
MDFIKRFFNLDIIFATLFVFGLLLGVSQIEINTDIIDPIGQALDNFQTTDLVYTAIRETPKKDTMITLVNMGNLSRGELGVLMMNLNKYNPAVIGIDARFLKDKTPYYLENGLEDGDSVLAYSFSQTKNLVLVTDMLRDEETGLVDSIVTSHPKFMRYANGAFANMITSKNDFRVARKVLTKEQALGKRQVFFPVRIASFIDSSKAERFLARNKELETIYYRGNINNFSGETDKFGQKDAFNKIDVQEGMEGTFDPKLVTGKAIVMGYLGESIQNDKYWDEDKFYTPLNRKFAGKSFPDMYGVTVHANIVSMVLNETYVDELDPNITLAINLFLCIMGVVIFSYIHHYIKLWWDGLSVICFLFMILALIIFRLYIFDWYFLEVDIDMALVFLFVLGNFLELYYEYAKPGFLWTVQKVTTIVSSKKL